MNTKKWKSIGTVLGETNISEFYFSLKNLFEDLLVSFQVYQLKYR